MWIRSQYKAVLRNVNNIEIMKFEGEKYTTILGDGCHLGVYSSHEKALKVLDEIQTCIMTEHHYHTDDANCTRRFFTKEWKETYQMPQDEDVEV